ncbi:MAG: lytic murein transglycosylase B [Pseudomonadota bacterium]
MKNLLTFLVTALMVLIAMVSVGAALAETPAQGDSEPAPYPRPYAERTEVLDYARWLAREHNFEEAELISLFAQAQQRQDIIERISRPAEKVWTWARYKNLLVDEPRIKLGVAFWETHAATLQRAAEVYGVAPEYVLAILGIETRFGERRGDFPVLDALFTLGFDYPPRADFFRSELTQFLLLAREEQKDPLSLSGSYAGAMGYGQFISSSYRHYAVDFDGDGVRDIWDNPVDAIGSIANYFAQHRWRGGQVAVQGQVAEGQQQAVDALTTRGLALKRTVGEIRQAGLQIEPQVSVADDAKAALYKMEGNAGTEYWLALHDFYVITRYNRSQLYALAVYHLAEAIKQEIQPAAAAAG